MEGAEQFFSYLAHCGEQITDDETNYDVFHTSIRGSGKLLVIYYTFDSKTVTLESIVIQSQSP
jgi:hypothetical protein